MSARETRLCGISSTKLIFNIYAVVLLTDALDEGPVFLSEQVRPEMFFSSIVLRTAKVQICVTSQGKNTSESVRGSRKYEIVFSRRIPLTNTITEVHNRLCTTDDYFLIISAYLDYYRSRR